MPNKWREVRCCDEDGKVKKGEEKERGFEAAGRLFGPAADV